MKSPISIIAIAIAAFPFTAVSQSDDNPFGGKNAAKPASGRADMANPEVFNIEVCYEAFSLPLAQAAKLQRMSLPDSELYSRIVRMIPDKKVKQETLSILRVRSGQRATTRSISEIIYPTEYEPPELPNSVGVQVAPKAGPDPVPDDERRNVAPSPPDFSGLRTPATPTAFDVRNVGHTLEIDPVSGREGRTIQLSMVPEHVTHVGEFVHGQELSETHMPEFETQRIRTGVTVRSGVPHLLGTISRPPLSKVDPDSANTTWFAFVTARPVVPE